jgi:hypothetical protein
MNWKFSKKNFTMTAYVLLCIVITNLPARIVMAGNVNNQGTVRADIQVSGIVTSADDNSPLPGASVAVKGGSLGTVTNTDGRYTLAVPEGSTLIFRYIGYLAQEIAVGGRTHINVAMALDQKRLDEVVVIGYGVQRKGDVTSSVASVKQEDFVKGAVRDAAQLVQQSSELTDHHP